MYVIWAFCKGCSTPGAHSLGVKCVCVCAGVLQGKVERFAEVAVSLIYEPGWRIWQRRRITLSGCDVEILESRSIYLR